MLPLARERTRWTSLFLFFLSLFLKSFSIFDYFRLFQTISETDSPHWFADIILWNKCWKKKLFQAPPPCLDLTDFPIKADFFEGKCCFVMKRPNSLSALSYFLTQGCTFCLKKWRKWKEQPTFARWTKFWLKTISQKKNERTCHVM